MMNNYAASLNKVLAASLPVNTTIGQYKRGIVNGTFILSSQDQASILSHADSLKTYGQSFAIVNRLNASTDALQYFYSTFAPSTAVENGQLVESNTTAGLTATEIWTCALDNFTTDNCGSSAIVGDKYDLIALANASISKLTTIPDVGDMGVLVMLNNFAYCSGTAYDLPRLAKEIGLLHNKALSYINTNWTTFQSNNEGSSDLEILSNKETEMFNFFSNNYILKNFPNYAIAASEIDAAVSSVNQDISNQTREIYPNDESDAYTMSPILYTNKKNTLINLIDSLNSTEHITSKEITFLKSILNEVQNIEERRSYSSYPELQNHFNEVKGEGLLSNVFIQVAKNSYDYWTILYPIQAKPNDPPYTTNMVPVWVGLDALGALGGAGSSLWSQRNNAKIDWWEVGGQAVIWGAVGSIPASRGFRLIFK